MNIADGQSILFTGDSITDCGRGYDRIHPNQTGHMIIARAFLAAVGFEWGK